MGAGRKPVASNRCNRTHFCHPVSNSANIIVIGVLLLTAHFGGAMATHLEHGEMPYIPVIATIITLIWVAHYLRNPEMLTRFTIKINQHENNNRNRSQRQNRN
jgi:hypothetical protein